MSAWLERLTGTLLLQPWWGVLLLPLGALLWWRRRARPAAATFGAAALLDGDAPLPPSWRVRLLGVPVALHALAVALAIVALCKPCRRVELPAVREGIDLLLCLDTSSSMAQRDLDDRRHRLEVAKTAAMEFVAGRPDDRIGLVRFARYPDVVCPPTLDHQALEAQLRDLPFVERDGPEDATGIGTAVARAVQVLSRSRARSRVVVLVTDGEENVAAAGQPREVGPLQAAQLAAQHGVKVYALAVGEGSAAADGRVVPIDTSQIEQLAQRTGGRFFRARDAAAVQHVYAEIDVLERAPVPAPRFRFEDRYAGFVAAALVAVLLATLLRRTWFEVVP